MFFSFKETLKDAYMLVGIYKPLSGIIRERKHAQIRYVRLNTDLSLVASATDPIVSGIHTWAITH